MYILLLCNINFTVMDCKMNEEKKRKNKKHVQRWRYFTTEEKSTHLTVVKSQKCMKPHTVALKCLWYNYLSSKTVGLMLVSISILHHLGYLQKEMVKSNIVTVATKMKEMVPCARDVLELEVTTTLLILLLKA